MNAGIYGITESGKTTLAKIFCQRYHEKGIETIVVDPLRSRGWAVDPDNLYATATPAQQYARETQYCAIFIDEGPEELGQWDKANHWFATQSRHWGHNCYFIAQRANDIAKTVRSQCRKLYLFRTDYKDAREHARRWMQPKLERATKLPQFHFFEASRFGTVRERRVNLKTLDVAG